MGASSVTGTGNGEAGVKVNPLSNVENVLFAASANDGDTIASNVNVVFLAGDGNYTLVLPSAETKVGCEIFFRTRDLDGNTVVLDGIYGDEYSVTNDYINIRVISDGSEWTINNYYTDD